MSKKVMMRSKDNPLEMDFSEQRPNLFKRFGIAFALISLGVCAFVTAILMM